MLPVLQVSIYWMRDFHVWDRCHIQDFSWGWGGTTHGLLWMSSLFTFSRKKFCTFKPTAHKNVTGIQLGSCTWFSEVNRHVVSDWFHEGTHNCTMLLTISEKFQVCWNKIVLWPYQWLSPLQLMNYLFSFLESDRPHGTLLAGYFSKVKSSCPCCNINHIFMGIIIGRVYSLGFSRHCFLVFKYVVF